MRGPFACAAAARALKSTALYCSHSSVGIVRCYSCAKFDGASSNGMDSRLLSEKWIKTCPTCLARVLCERPPQAIRCSIALIELHRCAKSRASNSRQRESFGSPQCGNLLLICDCCASNGVPSTLVKPHSSRHCLMLLVCYV